MSFSSITIDGNSLDLALKAPRRPPFAGSMRSVTDRAKTEAHIAAMQYPRIKPTVLPPKVVVRPQSAGKRRPVSAGVGPRRIDTGSFRFIAESDPIFEIARQNACSPCQYSSAELPNNRYSMDFQDLRIEDFECNTKPRPQSANSHSSKSVKSSAFGFHRLSQRPQSAMEIYDRSDLSDKNDFKAEIGVDKQRNHGNQLALDLGQTIHELFSQNTILVDPPLSVNDKILEYHVTDGMRQRVQQETERLNVLYHKQITFYHMRHGPRPQSAPASNRKSKSVQDKASKPLPKAIINNATDFATKMAINKAALATFLQSSAYHVLRMRSCDRAPDQVESLARHLRSLSAFAKVSDFALNQLCASMLFMELFEGETVFEQGDIGGEWFVILKGSVKINIKKPGASEAVTVATVHAGDGFGELALIHDKPRAASVVTNAHCIFARVEKSEYVRYLFY